MNRAVTDIAGYIDLGSGISGKLSFNTLLLRYPFFLFNDILSKTEDK